MKAGDRRQRTYIPIPPRPEASPPASRDPHRFAVSPEERLYYDDMKGGLDEFTPSQIAAARARGEIL